MQWNKHKSWNILIEERVTSLNSEVILVFNKTNHYEKNWKIKKLKITFYTGCPKLMFRDIYISATESIFCD